MKKDERPAGEGHNSDAPHSSVTRAAAKTGENDVGGVAGARLKSIVERIERLEEEKSAIGNDIKDIYTEAKGTGFDPKTIRKLVRMRKMDANKLAEEDSLLEVYRAAIGL